MKLPNTGELKPYPGMKDSGVSWLNQVPVHWDLLRGKFLFRCIDVRSSTGEEELLTVSSERGVVPRSSATVTMFKAESYVGYKLCWPGDLVINSLWAWGRGLGVSRYHGIVSSAYGVYRLHPPYSKYSDYIHRLVRSTPFNFELHVRSKGIWRSRLQLTDEAFLDALFPVPPVEEQAAIVRFLDHADRRIQRYIHAKQKLIALLEEQKQAIIHHAVTGQIDVRTGQPYPSYKDSGVEWLDDVPEHWQLLRLKDVAQVQAGLTLGKDYRSTRTISRPYLRVALVHGSVFFSVARLNKNRLLSRLSTTFAKKSMPSRPRNRSCPTYRLAHLPSSLVAHLAVAPKSCTGYVIGPTMRPGCNSAVV